MLFLSDLDGTLMNASCEIAKDDVEMIHQWTQKHSFGFVTGRDEAFCKDLAQKYDLQCDCMITDNGASAIFKGKHLYSSLIDLEMGIDLCKKIISLKEADLFFTDENGNRYYPIREYGKKSFEDFKKKQPFLGSFVSVDILEYLATRTRGLPKLSLYVGNHLDELLEKYKGMFSDFEVMVTSKDYIEITKKSTNKWSAFEHLPVDQAVFIGDGENDRCILENLKDTYVMNHAPDSIKKLGTCVNSVAQAMCIEREKENV